MCKLLWLCSLGLEPIYNKVAEQKKIMDEVEIGGDGRGGGEEHPPHGSSMWFPLWSSTAGQESQPHGKKNPQIRANLYKTASFYKSYPMTTKISKYCIKFTKKL